MKGFWYSYSNIFALLKVRRPSIICNTAQAACITDESCAAHHTQHISLKCGLPAVTAGQQQTCNRMQQLLSALFAACRCWHAQLPCKAARHRATVIMLYYTLQHKMLHIQLATTTYVALKPCNNNQCCFAVVCRTWEAAGP
jgi:hypothetical protein